MKSLRQRLPYIVCYLSAFVLGIKQVREPDTWWQLLSGRWMLEHGAITRTDVFSYTMAGHQWVNVKWLYEIFIALVEKAAGPQGVMLLQAVVNVLLVHLLFKIIKLLGRHLKLSVTGFASVIAALLFLAASEFRMAGRPEMFSHLFCALYLFLLLKDPKLNWRTIALLALLQCLWCNMHEAYPLGLVIAGVFLVANVIAYTRQNNADRLGPVTRPAALLFVLFPAILINPNGMQLWKQAFEIYRQVMSNKYTSELYSFTDAGYWTWQAMLNVVMLCAVLIFWLTRIKKILADPMLLFIALLTCVFGYLSLAANRNIPFVQIVLLPAVAVIVRSFLGISFLKNLETRSAQAASLAAALFYVSVVSNGFYKVTGSRNRYGLHVSMLHNPAGAAQFIKEHNIQGPGFSDYFVSSYLLWDLYPQYRSFIDLRDLDVFPQEFFARYFELYEHPEKFAELDKQYHFNYVVVSTSQLAALQVKLYWEKGYNLVYADPVAAIFLKENEANKALNEDTAAQKLFSWPGAPRDPAWCTLLTKLLNPAAGYAEEDERNAPKHAALFYNQVQNYPLAISLLLPEMDRFQNDRDARNTLANIYLNYAGVTADPALKQARLDSAGMFSQMPAH